MSTVEQLVNRGTVSVGSSFFAKSLQDYYSWPSAMCREFLQNGVDCGSANIRAEIKLEPELCTDTHTAIDLLVTNDGRPMTRKELFDKLLQLGETSKSGAAIGGFGKAKEILYFAHRNYSIKTGIYVLLGSGADYTWAECDPASTLMGTQSSVGVMLSKPSFRSHEENLKNFIDRWITVADHGKYKDCKVYINGQHIAGQERIRPELDITSEDENFRLSNNPKCTAGYVYVRSGGVFMYFRSVAGNRSYYMDLKKCGREMLTANRDGLKNGYQNEFDMLVAKLSNNNLSASRTFKHVDTRTKGLFFAVEFPVRSGPIEVKTQTADSLKTTLSEPAPDAKPVRAEDILTNRPTAEPETLYFRHSVLLASYGSTKVSAKHWKQGEVSESVVRLLSVWSEILKTIHLLTQDKALFATGLIFDCDKDSPRLAEYREVEGHHYFLINPLDNERRYRYTAKDYASLIAVAAHEYAHKLHGCHTEAFASHMTAVSAKCFEYMRMFQRVLNNRRMYEFSFPTEWKTQ